MRLKSTLHPMFIDRESAVMNAALNVDILFSFGMPFSHNCLKAEQFLLTRPQLSTPSTHKHILLWYTC